MLVFFIQKLRCKCFTSEMKLTNDTNDVIITADDYGVPLLTKIRTIIFQSKSSISDSKSNISDSKSNISNSNNSNSKSNI